MNTQKTQNTLPFDVLKNQTLLNESDNDDVLGFIRETENNFKGVVKNWFIPIITEQSMLEKILEKESYIKSTQRRYSFYGGFSNDWMNMFPQSKLYVEIEDGKLTSVEVLFNKGKKLYRVISQKDYGVIKSRMELTEKGKLVPYGKCDLIPFEGEYNEWVIQKGRGYNGRKSMFLSEKLNYVDGLKDGECFTYYKTSRWDELGYFQNNYSKDDFKKSFEKTTYQNGKKNGFYVNTKKGLEGNYINDKQNGKWLILNELFSSKINGDFHLENLFETYKYNHRYSYGRSGNMEKQLIEVNYVNGLLHGEFRTLDNIYVGSFDLGKMNGVFTINNITYDEDDNETISVRRVSQIKDGKRIGIDFGGISDSGSYLFGIQLKNEHGISKSIRLGRRMDSDNEHYSDELLNKLNHEISDETIEWIIQNTNGEFNSKEDFLNHYFVREVKSFELEERGNGREHYGYTPVKVQRINNFCLQHGMESQYSWNEDFLKKIVEKYDYPFYKIGEDGKYQKTHSEFELDSVDFKIPCYEENNEVTLLQFNDKLYPNEDSESIQQLKEEVIQQRVKKIISIKETIERDNKEREKEEERVRLILEEREKQEQLLKEEEEKRKKENEKKMKKLKEKQLKEEGLHITSFPMD